MGCLGSMDLAADWGLASLVDVEAEALAGLAVLVCLAALACLKAGDESRFALAWALLLSQPFTKWPMCSKGLRLSGLMYNQAYMACSSCSTSNLG